MPRCVLVLLLFLFLPSLTQAQQPAATQVSNKYPTAADHIQALKNGVLLVRLKTSQNKVDALQKMGKTDWVKKVIRDQKAENQLLVDAFKEYYTFTPVYFFFSDDSEKVLRKQFKGVLYDKNLQPAFETDSFTSKFLVADFGLIGLSTGKINKAGERKEVASQSSTIEGLVLSDENLVQLTDPFPYFVRSFKSLGKDLRRSEARMVQKLNARLIEFSKRNPPRYEVAKAEVIAEPAKKLIVEETPESETEPKKGVSRNTIIILGTLVAIAGALYRIL